MNVRKLMLVVLVIVCGSGFGASSAVAAVEYGSFEEACESSQALCTGATPMPFPFGFAVDNSIGLEASGDVYVANIGFGPTSVVRFTASGNPAPFKGSNPNIKGNQLSFPSAEVGVVDVAVEYATGDFYAVDRATDSVSKFTPAGEPVASGSFPLPSGVGATAIAVDNSEDPLDMSRGDIYVSDVANKVIYQLSSTGVLLGEIKGDAEHPLAEPQSLAVDSQGSIYVVNRTSSSVDRFSPAGVWEEALSESKQPEGVTIDPSTGDVLVTENVPGFFVQPYTETGVPLPTFGAGTVAEPEYASGIAAGAGNHYVYVSVSNQNRGIIFAPHAEATEPPKEVVTGSASEFGLEGTSASLSGKLNPGGLAHYYFEYGTAACNVGRGTCGAKTSEAGPPLRGDTQQSADPVKVSGLEPSTTYHFWIVAVNGKGPAVHGGEQTFTTPSPTEAVTEPATRVTARASKLNGAIASSVGGTFHYYFEYGRSTSYGQRTPDAEVTLPINGEASVGVVVTGLEPGLEYHFKLVAESFKSSDMTFVTELVAPSEVHTEPVGAVSATIAHLNGRANPGGSAQYYFEYGTEPCEPAGNAGNGICGAATVPVRSVGGDVEQEVPPIEIVNLAPKTTYHYWIVVTNSDGTVRGDEQTFVTNSSVSPTITGESFSNTGPHGATLRAEVNPNGLATSYYFEYGPTNSYGSKTAVFNLKGGEGVVSATAVVSGLTPDTSYHFRSVVTNEEGSKAGSDVGFKTLVPVFEGLPDGRVYEMVTPLENEDAEVYVPQDGLGGELGQGQGVTVPAEFQSAADGDSIIYFGDPTKGGTGNGGNGLGNSYLATRYPGGGWKQVNTSNLSPGSQPPPLFSGTPPNRSAESLKISVVSSSADGSRVFFEADDALIPGEGSIEKELADDVKSEVEHNEVHNYLYESFKGHLSLIDVSPGGKVASNAVFGDQPDVSNVVSSSGSRVFWTDLNTGGLYVRENPGQPESPHGAQGECTVVTDACTVQVDASQAHGPGGGGQFWTASEDGSKVFFTDSDAAGLTSSTLPGSGANLYEYEVSQTVGQSGVLKDLTTVTEAGVEGVIGSSENGEYVYFVATSALDNRENDEHRTAVKGGYNLYVIRGDESPRFIATLSQKDGGQVEPFVSIGNVAFGDWQPALSHRTAEVSPNGEGLVFMSEESLTGYSNRVDNSNLDEVFAYEAGSGHLFCVSCSQSGEPPSANVEAEGDGRVAGFVQVAWGNGGLRWMSENGGKVFFDSGEPLVAQDTNEAQDVYEWEREGEGSCVEPEGCVYLLSGGTSHSASWLEGESVSGNDVFIDTRAQLTPEDHSETYNLFDARVGGVKPATEPTCSGTGCQGIPSPPPTFATPPSVTFEGVGNFPSAPVSPSTQKTVKKKATVKCTKGKKLSHGKCIKVKSTSKKTKAKKAKSNKGGK
jgi:hypothetical protein